MAIPASPRRRRSPWTPFATAVVVLLAMSACTHSGANSGAAPTTGHPVTSAPLSAEGLTRDGLKPVIRGLLDRTKLPPPRFWGVVTGFVVDVAWADLQPDQAGGLVPDNPIDKALRDLGTARSSGAPPMLVKLRVRAGTFAPEWAKQLDGPPVAGKDTFNGKQGTLPRFWTPAFKQAYDHLQQLLVARYDATAEVAETQITRCMTFTAEPLIRQARTNETLRALVAAGFTSALDEQCQREQIEEHLVWQRTRSGLSFNPYQRVGADGKVTIDPAFAVSLMDQCRKVLGKRCVLENHSIRWPAKSSEYGPVYAGMDRLGAPISYQTATPDRIGDWRKTLQWAVDHHGNSVELNRGYPQYDLKNLETFAHALASNPPEG